jgi:pSer/pThr/pTyr-binding forkhead associated (FHA) protein
MATMLVMNGRHEGEWYTIGDTKPMVFGRDESLLAEILDPRVSRHHLEVKLDLRSNRWVAADLNSRNGTKVNGQRLAEAVPLKEGDVVQIGHTVMVFTEREFEDDDDVRAYMESTRQRVGDTLEKIDDREQYTEAAAVFSRLFKNRRR